MSQIIWTNHLRERIQQRGLSPSMVDKAIRFPDQTIKSTTTDSVKHIKMINGYKVVAAVKRQGSDWVVTSAWWDESGSRPKHSNKIFLEVWIENLLKWIEKKIFKN